MTLLNEEMEVWVLALIRRVVVPDDHPKLVKLLGRIQAEFRKADIAESLLMKERDHANDMADKLAAKIAERDKLEIGEHSSGNCPWQNALDGVSEEPEAQSGSASTAN